jgi:hypothetical protein
MTATTALARTPNLPPSLHDLQVGKLRLNSFAESNASPRRYHVRDWHPSDGGLAAWKFNNSDWSWLSYAPRNAREFITIIRLADGAIVVAPRGWWECDPRGMPRDEDSWAHAAWRTIDAHYETQCDWRLQ